MSERNEQYPFLSRYLQMHLSMSFLPVSTIVLLNVSDHVIRKFISFSLAAC